MRHWLPQRPPSLVVSSRRKRLPLNSRRWSVRSRPERSVLMRRWAAPGHSADKAAIAVEKAQEDLTAAMTEHASHDGRLIELRKLRDAENLAAAETRLRETTEHHAAFARPRSARLQ